MNSKSDIAKMLAADPDAHAALFEYALAVQMGIPSADDFLTSRIRYLVFEWRKCALNAAAENMAELSEAV